TTMRANVSSQLDALLKTEAAMLETWLRIQESNAITQASDQDLRNDVYRLLETAAAPGGSNAAAANPDLAAARESLRKQLQPALTAQHYEGFAILDRSRTVL